MFLGTHTPRLDDKGRLFLPAKFRDELAEGVVITRGQERCLYVWPRASFMSYADRLQTTPITNKRGRDFLRMLSAGASDEAPDKQGRITIPTVLREYAGLDKDCTVIGAMHRVEIWSTGAWTEYQNEKESDFADISEEVMPDLL